MKRYNGKDVQATIMQLNKAGNLIFGGKKFVRGELSVKMDDKNVMLDNNLDGQQWPAENSLVEDRDHGTFDINLLATQDNSISILTNNFFNNPVFESSPLFAGKKSGLDSVIPNLAIITNDESNPLIYQSFVNEIEIDASAKDKFLYFKASGEIVKSNSYTPGVNFDFSSVADVTGKPFRVKDMSILDAGSSTNLANITKFNLKLKNGAKVIDTIEETSKGALAYTGEGSIEIMNDDTTSATLNNYLNDTSQNFHIIVAAQADDGSTFSMNLYNVKLASYEPDYDRKKSQLITKYTFHILRQEGTNSVEISI